MVGSSVRERVHHNRVRSLLVVGTREKRFEKQAAYAEKTIPHLDVVRANSGHAVNIDTPTIFNDAVIEFIGRT